MHSYQPSRGRIFFQVLCVFGMSVTLAGAWLQTGAIALAAAAFIAALYGVVHFFDLFRNRAVEIEPQRIDFNTPPEMPTVPVLQETSVRLAVVETQLDADNVVMERQPVVEAEPIEPAPLPAKAGRGAKTSRKGGSRPKSAPKHKEVTPLAPEEEAEGGIAPVFAPSASGNDAGITRSA